MSMGESASTSSNNGASAGTANWFDEAHLDIHGIDTAVFTAGPAEAAEWVALLPRATLRIFAGAGHLLLDERPDAVAAISEFLDLDRT